MAIPGQKPKLCQRGIIDQDCARLKERKEAQKERADRKRIEPVVRGEIEGKTRREVARAEGVSGAVIQTRAETPLAEKIRQEYRTRREKTVKAAVGSVNRQHKVIIRGQFSDPGKARAILEGIKHADKVMGLGQDQTTDQAKQADRVAGARAELAGLVLMFVKPEHREQVQEAEYEELEPGQEGQGGVG